MAEIWTDRVRVLRTGIDLIKLEHRTDHIMIYNDIKYVELSRNGRFTRTFAIISTCNMEIDEKAILDLDSPILGRPTDNITEWKGTIRLRILRIRYMIQCPGFGRTSILSKVCFFRNLSMLGNPRGCHAEYGYFGAGSANLSTQATGFFCSPRRSRT